MGREIRSVVWSVSWFLVAAAFFAVGTLANAGTLTSTGVSDDANGSLFIYDSGNNVTWWDMPFIDTGTNLSSASWISANVTPTVNGTPITGWHLPSLSQLQTLDTELGAFNTTGWAPFQNLPGYDTDTFVSSTTGGSNGWLERDTLITGHISTGTNTTQYGDAIYFTAGNLLANSLLTVPAPSVAASILMLVGVLGVGCAKRAMAKEVTL